VRLIRGCGIAPYSRGSMHIARLIVRIKRFRAARTPFPVAHCFSRCAPTALLPLLFCKHATCSAHTQDTSISRTSHCRPRPSTAGVMKFRCRHNSHSLLSRNVKLPREEICLGCHCPCPIIALNFSACRLQTPAAPFSLS